ncbi:MAG: XdhC/CoxI family protein [Clostridium sp.]|uniref:XdhC/CoxI family protein n=1 Tax=Clostridium sp. TaxID=1506 RepID=UPI002FCA1827
MFKHIYNNLQETINSGIECVLVTYLNKATESSGKILNKILINSCDIDSNDNNLEDETLLACHNAILTGKIQTLEVLDKLVIIEPFAPNPRLIVFGGGHIAKPLCEFASRVGFSITLIDDRPFFANSTRFPEAETIICDDFENSFNKIEFRKSDFVVIITRGHRHDGIVLRHVIEHELSYIGMIGSKRRVRGMMEELKSEGYNNDVLSSINSPIGLDIAAITPDEIAISIVGELISFKNKGIISRSSKKYSFPEFDRDVIESVSKDDLFESALITILSSKGSVPRKSGAKMIAYFDGRTIGSIGGGCSEAAVITSSREIMGSKGYLLQHVDMTGDVAESEGMVCGGTMEVLVESF